MLKQMIRHHTAVYVSRHRRNPVLRGAARAARSYTEMIENRDYGLRTNGEQWLLRQIAATRPDVVFDVGANIGDWTAEVRAAVPTARVHAFEIVPATAAQLARRFAADPAVTLVRAGLYDEPGRIRVRHYPDRPSLSGVELPELTGYLRTLERESLEVPVERGDDYCREHGITHVDFLKIDAEGSDHRVLRGFERMLRTGAIGMVQFEYGRASILNKFLLVDFYRLFTDAGMVVGKLYPNYVDFRDYDIERHEDFLGPNFIAVPRDRTDLRTRLAGR